MRINGFVRPFNPLQVISWVLFAVFIASFHMLALPHFSGAEYILEGFYLLAVLLSVVYAAQATRVNPVDPLSPHSPEYKPRYEANAGDLWCDYCREYVGQSSKHCRACDKCVHDFDHHCQWLNNCIGGANYNLFVGSMVSVMSLVCLQMGTFIYMLVESYEHTASLQKSLCDWYGGEFYIKLYRGLVITVMVLLLATFLGLGHLICFHIYIKCKGISTYDWILLRRNARAAKDAAQNDVELGGRQSPTAESRPVDAQHAQEDNKAAAVDGRDVKIAAPHTLSGTKLAELRAEEQPPPVDVDTESRAHTAAGSTQVQVAAVNPSPVASQHRSPSLRQTDAHSSTQTPRSAQPMISAQDILETPPPPRSLIPSPMYALPPVSVKKTPVTTNLPGMPQSLGVPRDPDSPSITTPSMVSAIATSSQPPPHPPSHNTKDLRKAAGAGDKVKMPIESW